MDTYTPVESSLSVGKALSLTGYLVLVITIMLGVLTATAVVSHTQMVMHADKLFDAIEHNNEAIRSLERKILEAQKAQKMLQQQVDELEN